MKHKKVKTLVSSLIKKRNKALTFDEINDATQKAWSKS